MYVEYCREIEGIFLLKLKNIDSISDAYRLVGYSIFKEGEPERKESDSLLDFSVEDVHGRHWGTVEAFNPESKNPLLEIDSDGETIYIPFSDSIIVKLDKKKRIITIDPPDGLMDLNK
jgi:16S rRNA processing protein RimM